MRCERCQGQGYTRYDPTTALWTYCSDCLGSGISYCCDTAGSNQPNCWPLKGSDGLYDPIDLTKGTEK